MAKRKPAPRPKSGPKRPPKGAPWQVILLVAISLGAYANSLVNDFVGDDKDQLLGNPVITQHEVGKAILTGVWAFRGASANYYRPLQILVYMLFHALFGFHAFAFHLFSVLVHAANTVLVYRLAVRIAGRERAAVPAALIFAVHPIHTEVVDWVAAYPDLVVTLIVLAGTWLFARQKGSPSAPSIAGHSALYLAALSVKETGVMLLPLYLAYEWIYLGRRFRELKRNLVLYAAMTGTFAIYLMGRWSALGSLAPTEQMFFQLTPAQFVMSATVTLAQYLWKLVYPSDLNFFHVFHPTVSISMAFLLALAILAALAVTVLRRLTSPTVMFSLVWTVLALAPALNITGVGQNVFAERYLYLPSAGFAWIAGLLWSWCEQRRAGPAWAAGLATLCIFSWQTAERNSDWRDDLTMLRKTAIQSPDAGVIHNNLAGLYVHRDEFDRALEQEREAVRCEPRSGLFHRQYGMLLLLHDPDAARKELETALRLEPSDVTAREVLEELREGGKRLNRK
ncbi:MAG TPA: glycosyltransferase family 39 protein [Bryobacteraceae bacterium]|nr:glycosyltransferase family 39 protein [Bryobacteraceae bacterium]